MKLEFTIERLLENKHIDISGVDILINMKRGLKPLVAKLYENVHITSAEVLELLRDKEIKETTITNQYVSPPSSGTDPLDSPLYSVPIGPNETLEFPNYPASVINVLNDTIG